MILSEEEILNELMKLVQTIRGIAVTTTRDNANVGNNFSAKLLQIASAANKAVVTLDLPEDMKEAYLRGLIHIHDLDSYDLTINCLNIDTAKALGEGFNTGYGTINKPKRIDSAASVSCIVLQSTQNDMFGGQGHYNFDNDMAEYVEFTEQELLNEEMERCADYDPNILYTLGNLKLDMFTKNKQNRILQNVEKKLIKNVKQAMQIIVYNLNSMHSRAGSQIPFSSLNIGIPKNKYAAMVCEYFLKAYNNGLGKGEQPIFPNVIFRTKEGVNLNSEDPYYYLFKLACKVAGNRMNPTFLSCDSPMSLPYYKRGILPATMGCRTRIMDNINGETTPNRRGNIAPVSMNLVQLAIEAKKEADTNGQDVYMTYLVKLEALMQLCEKQLMHRYDVLKELKGTDLPFIVGEKLIMGSEDMSLDDSIEPILKNGTWSIGFVGLAEALTHMFGKHHGEDKDVWNKGYSIIERIREYCDEATERNQLNFTCYATPAEGLSGRFTQIDNAIYGSIPGVTDKEYYTNGFHIPVEFNISVVEKINLEAPFHKLCNAGHISYIELDGPPVDDPDLVERIVRYSFTQTEAGYIGINFGIQYCKDCGTMHVKGTRCPNCESARLQGIHRVTGYLSLDERFGSGKTAERNARVSHEITV